jgi:very-short-patch-repair endonuclease
VRRIATLRPDETARRSGIPVTTPTRTLFDLAGTVDVRILERACSEAIALRRVRPEELSRLHARHGGRKGVGTLAEVLAIGPTVTRSEAEERFLALVQKAGLPKPDVNVAVLGREVDFLWRPEQLVVEVDGFAFHASRRAFEADRLRDASLAAVGLRVVRVTWRQIVSEPHGVIARLAGALAVTLLP